MGCLSICIGLWAYVSIAPAADLPGVAPMPQDGGVSRHVGVPHIYAPSAEAVSMRWAGRRPRIARGASKELHAGDGRKCEIRRPGGCPIGSDRSLVDNYGTSKRNFDRIRPQIQEQLRAFVNGVNGFYAGIAVTFHPGGRPRVDEYMVVAFFRFFLYGWSSAGL